jgi:hypothetical protein
MNLYIEEAQTTQWPKEKVQKDKQRSPKHAYKAKDRGTAYQKVLQVVFYVTFLRGIHLPLVRVVCLVRPTQFVDCILELLV